MVVAIVDVAVVDVASACVAVSSGSATRATAAVLFCAVTGVLMEGVRRVQYIKTRARGALSAPY